MSIENIPMWKQLLRGPGWLLDHGAGMLAALFISLMSILSFTFLGSVMRKVCGGTGTAGLIHVVVGWFVLFGGLILLGLVIMFVVALVMKLCKGKWLIPFEKNPQELKFTLKDLGHSLYQIPVFTLILSLVFAIPSEGLWQFANLIRALSRDYPGSDRGITSQSPLAWFEEQGGMIDGWYAEMMAVNLAFVAGIATFCTLMSTVAGIKYFGHDNDPFRTFFYDKHLSGYRRPIAFVALIIGCVVGFLAYYSFCKPGLHLLAVPYLR